MEGGEGPVATAVIGTAFVDVKGFPFDSYDPVGRNLGAVKVAHGGVGRNVAENFANVGMPVEFVGMLEESALGCDVERRLREIGVGVDHVLCAPEQGIGIWAAIFDEKGDLAGSVSQMPDVARLEEHLRAYGEEAIRAAGAVVLEIDLSERIAEMVIDLAETHGKPVYAIVGNLSVALARPDLLARTSCFICNEVEAAKLFGDEVLVDFSPEQMCAYLPAAAAGMGIGSMVVTLGARGAVYCEGACVGMCPAAPAEVVDTTGAGDAFFSGTVMGLVRGLPLSEAVGYGAKLASATVSWDEATCPPCKDLFD